MIKYKFAPATAMQLTDLSIPVFCLVIYQNITAPNCEMSELKKLMIFAHHVIPKADVLFSFSLRLKQHKTAAYFHKRRFLLFILAYSPRCGMVASAAKALTKSASLTTSCFSEPRRRTVTVRFSFSLAPTTAITGILAKECSRIL